MKEKIKKLFSYNLENSILQNMTFVVIFIILIIWILFLFWVIEIEYWLTSTWAIIAFWYWYKRYEQDKYLMFLNNFMDTYLEERKIIENLRCNWKTWFEMMTFWMKYFYFYESGILDTQKFALFESYLDDDILWILDNLAYSYPDDDNDIESKIFFDLSELKTLKYKTWTIRFYNYLINKIDFILNNYIRMNEILYEYKKLPITKKRLDNLEKIRYTFKQIYF